MHYYGVINAFAVAAVGIGNSHLQRYWPFCAGWMDSVVEADSRSQHKFGRYSRRYQLLQVKKIEYSITHWRI